MSWSGMFTVLTVVLLVSRRVPPIVPGRYGYGRAPYATPLQTDAAHSSGMSRPHRQRRSAAADGHHRGGHRSNNPHRYSSPYLQPRPQQPQNSQVWAPLYQPGSENQVQPEAQPGSRTNRPQQPEERPYNPLPTSFCTGEHTRYRICNINVCTYAQSWAVLLVIYFWSLSLHLCCQITKPMIILLN